MAKEIDLLFSSAGSGFCHGLENIFTSFLSVYQACHKLIVVCERLNHIFHSCERSCHASKRVFSVICKVKAVIASDGLFTCWVHEPIVDFCDFWCIQIQFKKKFIMEMTYGGWKFSESTILSWICTVLNSLEIISGYRHGAIKNIDQGLWFKN